LAAIAVTVDLYGRTARVRRSFVDVLD